MVKRIRNDHQDFRRLIEGRIRKELGKFITSGKIFRTRGGNITIPQVDQPHIVYGQSDEGVGRGPGKDGDTIDKEGEKGKGPKAGQGHAEGITVSLDIEDYLRALKEVLELPNMKHKPNQTFEEIKIRYLNIAKTGPRSLLHKRRTWKEALRQNIASGDWNNKMLLPGFREPIRVLTINNDNLRYRQWREIKIPSSNAVIFFARDGSGSMDQFRCDIVSDMAWWIDQWIRQYYKKVERRYVWHDTEAKTLSEDQFYRLRYGGGTTCSSALTHIVKMLKHRYPPWKWNVYIFYFSDGENWTTDNEVFSKLLKEKLNPNIVNLFGMAQIFPWRYEGTLKEHLDKQLDGRGLNPDFVRTTQIGDPSADSNNWFRTWNRIERDEKTDQQIKDGIVDLLGIAKNRKKKEAAAVG